MKKITKEMIEAGNKIASDLMDVSISKSMGGLGGSQTWEDYKSTNKDIENLDLILAYANEEIDSVTAIYLAMDRCAENEIDVTHVNRVEIIGEGREFVRYFDSGEFSLQDDGRTLKIFVGRK